MIAVPNPGAIRGRRKDGGYSLLLVIFLVATMLIFGAVATRSVLVQGRRERETEMIWRGEQYERAIGLYFRKVGHYPTQLEDLSKQTNGIRFLRQPFTDPTNKMDGSWRLIYVGPAGQLIGSNRYKTMAEYQLATQGSLVPSASTTLNGAEPAATPLNGQPAPGAVNGSQTVATAGVNGTPNALPGTITGPGTGNAAGSSPFSPDIQPQPIGTGSIGNGPVIGGSIVGVGSTTKDASLAVFQGADTYDGWEFIFAPVNGGPVQVGPGQGTPQGIGPGSSGGVGGGLGGIFNPTQGPQVGPQTGPQPSPMSTPTPPPTQ